MRIDDNKILKIECDLTIKDMKICLDGVWTNIRKLEKEINAKTR